MKLAMNDKGIELDYDEDDAVEFIQNNLPKSIKKKLSEEDIIYLIDLIYEYYEENGFLDEEADDEIELDEEDLVNFVFENAKSANIENLTIEMVEAVIDGELSYCESLEEDEDE